MNIDVTGMKSSVHWGCQRGPGGGKSLGYSEHEPQLSLMEKKRNLYRPKLSCSKYLPGLKNSLQCTVVCIMEVSVKRSATIFRHSTGVDQGKCSLLRRPLHRQLLL